MNPHQVIPINLPVVLVLGTEVLGGRLGGKQRGQSRRGINSPVWTQVEEVVRMALLVD